MRTRFQKEFRHACQWLCGVWTIQNWKDKKKKYDPFYQYLLLNFTQYNVFLIFLLLCVTPTVTCWLLFFNVHGYEYLIFFPHLITSPLDPSIFLQSLFVVYYVTNIIQYGWLACQKLNKFWSALQWHRRRRMGPVCQ